MKYLLVIALSLGFASIALAQTSDDNPGSLWPSDYHSPLKDRTAHRVGDVLTVIISENSSAQFSASTSASKSDKTSVPQIGVPGLSQLWSLLSSSADSATGGAGATSQTGKYTARMSVIVTKVMPNGSLVIEGTRSVRVNKDTQMVRLSGVVRREDINSDNTVFSEKIADAEINTDGKGQISDRQRRGILTRILDWLF